MGGKRKLGLLRPFQSELSVLQRLADALLIFLAHYVAIALYPEPTAWGSHHTLATGAAILAFHFVGDASGLYAAWRGAPLRKELFKVWAIWAVVVPVLLFLAFVTKESERFSRFMSLVWFVLAPTIISVWRAALRLILQELRARGRNTRTVAIVGATEMGERLARYVQGSPWLGLRIGGFYEDRDKHRCHRVSEVGGVCGTFDDLVADCRDGSVDLVYMALPLKAEPRVQQLLAKLADTTASVYMVTDFFVFDLLHARWSTVGDIPVVSIFETPFLGINGWLKRIEDVILGTIFLSIASIPMALISIGVKLTSPGPVFFRQRRYGLNGDVIDVLKFRSMTVAEDGDKVVQAKKGDARITRFGAFLRRTSLDELPQLIHVVTGKMSLVGPRPHAVAHNELYRKKIQGYMLRHKIKPGLTGWAQVNGWRGETDTLYKMEMRIEHDLEYIRNWGLMLDLKIIFMTVFGSAVRKNAY